MTNSTVAATRLTTVFLAMKMTVGCIFLRVRPIEVRTNFSSILYKNHARKKSDPPSSKTWNHRINCCLVGLRGFKLCQLKHSGSKRDAPDLQGMFDPFKGCLSFLYRKIFSNSNHWTSHKDVMPQSSKDLQGMRASPLAHGEAQKNNSERSARDNLKNSAQTKRWSYWHKTWCLLSP